MFFIMVPFWYPSECGFSKTVFYIRFLYIAFCGDCILAVLPTETSAEPQIYSDFFVLFMIFLTIYMETKLHFFDSAFIF